MPPTPPRRPTPLLVDNSACCGGKNNWNILWRHKKCYCFKMRNINDQYLEITALTKIWGPLCKNIRLKTDYNKVQGLIWKKVGTVSGFIKKIQRLSCDFDIFWDFPELFLYRKNHESVLWITEPRLALSPWWTHDHGAARPLRGSGGNQGSHQWHHLKAELWRWPHDGAEQRRPVVLQWGDGSGHEEDRLESGWVQWIMGVFSLCLL
jgi:hypothetical protein